MHQRVIWWRRSGSSRKHSLDELAHVNEQSAEELQHGTNGSAAGRRAYFFLTFATTFFKTFRPAFFATFFAFFFFEPRSRKAVAARPTAPPMATAISISSRF